ncbi:MAG: hypothetical protein V4819_11445 [Verrucomicrobiota bacterium]
MNRHLGPILWVLMAFACEAAEIVSWKVPLSRYVWGVEAEKKVRLKSAPEPSPFFKDGDELWDLKDIPATQDQAATDPLPPQDVRLRTDPPLDWVVWNARSRRLVVKGDWNAIWQLHHQLGIEQLPNQCRLTAAVFEVPADGSPVTEKSMPAVFLSCVSRSGQEVEAVRQQEGKMIRVKGTANIGEDNRLVDLQLELSCALPGHPGMDLRTALSFQPGKPLWVARDFDGNKGLDLRVSTIIELTDGTPVAEAFLIQQGDTAMPIVVNRREMKRHRVGDKGWLAVQWMDPQFLSDMEPSGGAVDPFAEPPPKYGPEKPVPAGVSVPDFLKPWFNRPVLDLRELMKKSGVVDADFTGFVGYDPLAQRIFLFSNDEMELDKFEQLVSGGCNLSPRLVVVTLDGNRQTRLVTRSGVLSRLVRQSGDEKIIRSLEIEPTIGESYDLVHVRFDAVDNTKATPGELLKSAVLLRSGEPLAVLVGSAPDGKESTLRIKAEIGDVSE